MSQSTDDRETAENCAQSKPVRVDCGVRGEGWRVLPPSDGIDHNWHVTNDSDTVVAHCYGFDHSVEGGKPLAYAIAEALNDIQYLPVLAAAMLRAHRCSLPGWEKESCLKDDGEICSVYLGQVATKCEYYNKCQCDACTIARRVLTP